jgi:hypothetical protein
MGSAAAQAPEPYATAVRLVDHLFLEPTTVEPRAMLREAASELSNEVPWLFVRDEGDEGVVLLHGGGAALGRVRADTWDQLPAQLHELERLVRVSGYPLPDDVEPRLVVLDGMTRALDRYSRVLSGDGLSRFDTRLKGTTVGIGVSLAWHGAALNVTRVDPVGPAQAAGVRVGDRVLRIDGRSTTSMPLADAIERVQGPANTPVVLTISRQERRGGPQRRAARRAAGWL